MATKPETFEKSLARLESIISRLEGDELPLEESLTLFEEGVGLVKRCSHRLVEAERRVECLVATDGDDTTVPLDPEG